MKADRPSRTAHFVAIGRAIADAGLSHVPNFSDPTARVFLTKKGKRNLAGIEKNLREGKRGRGMMMAGVMADMMALRTSAIDAAVRDAMTKGARQLVILGAGYDGRAWRMTELAGVKVFEVDHPATQRDKKMHVAALPPSAGVVNFVSVDFERESVSEALDRGAHERSSPTCWIWEGVVMYLTRDAMRATLTSIANRSAPGSTLIVNYHAANRRLVVRFMFWLMGEPMISTWSAEAMAAELRAAGFVVAEDTGMADWNARFAHGMAKVGRASYMRIAVASKR